MFVKFTEMTSDVESDLFAKDIRVVVEDGPGDISVKFLEDTKEYIVVVGEHEIVYSSLGAEQPTGEGNLADSDPGTEIGTGT